MVAAENITSPAVERAASSDMSRRYSTGGVYAGDRHFLVAYELTLELLRRLFRADYVNIKPVTGNLAVLAILTGLTRPGDTILQVGHSDGGYPIRLAAWAGVEVLPLPFDPDSMNIRIGEAVEAIHRVHPSLVILGASEFLYPHPVREIAIAAHQVGATVAYDGSHVMGLIAGEVFQDPLREGADVLYGSMCKTFPGPQRGLIATNDPRIANHLDNVLAPPPLLQSCYHLNTAVALGVAAAEMLAFGAKYASQIVCNARTLAEHLVANGIPVITSSCGCTQSHQVILDNGGFRSPEARHIKQRLEECRILGDVIVRLGTQEVTRLGMREQEMEQIAVLISDAIDHRRPDAAIRADAISLASVFRKPRFVLDDGTAGDILPQELDDDAVQRAT
jgi:glycine hydroxymethyltransferase